MRSAGMDLQSAVFEDISSDISAYGISKPDRNIDHRRCRNLIVFFRRKAMELPSGTEADWQAGDIVFWSTRGDGRADHVGMISDSMDANGTHAIIHHWPGLPVCETEGLYRFPIAGHFRWRANESGTIKEIERR